LAGHVKEAKENAALAKAQKEKEERQRIAKVHSITEMMISIGTNYDQSREAFFFVNDYTNVYWKMERLLHMDLVTLEKMSHTWRADINLAKKKQEETRQVAQGDAANWKEYLGKLLAVPVPVFSTELYQDVSANLLSTIVEANKNCE
jgi:hypothetical protein